MLDCVPAPPSRQSVRVPEIFAATTLSPMPMDQKNLHQRDEGLGKNERDDDRLEPGRAIDV